MNTRKSFVFSDEAMDRLDKLRRACRMATSSAVIRLALMVLEDLLKVIAAGESIVIVGRDGAQRSYHPLVTLPAGAMLHSAPAVSH